MITAAAREGIQNMIEAHGDGLSIAWGTYRYATVHGINMHLLQCCVEDELKDGKIDWEQVWFIYGLAERVPTTKGAK